MADAPRLFNSPIYLISPSALIDDFNLYNYKDLASISYRGTPFALGRRQKDWDQGE